MRYTRRQAIGLGVALGRLVAVGGLGSLAACTRARGFGPLAAAVDETTGLELLELPHGFRYWSLGWTGDPLDDGTPMPPRVDGMGVFESGDGALLLVRNHEDPHARGVFAAGAPTYDPLASGGTTTLRVDARRGRLLGARASLCGTVMNCSGGITPWESWLSCEEVRGGETLAPGALRHGYVFEVTARGEAVALPLRGLGRFRHEAASVDPSSGAVYLTEDETESGLYRFLPATPGALSGPGRLEMLAVQGEPSFDARRGRRVGEIHRAHWVTIEDPDPDDTLGPGRTFAQGRARGGAVFARLEGIRMARGLVFFTSTSGGELGTGQIWAYEPVGQTLELVHESEDPAVLDHPDSLAFHPGGGGVICEDGQRQALLRGLTRRGELFTLCRSRVVLRGERNGIRGDFSTSEFSGACFDPSGRWLFVNVQSPGFTVSITGPWERGFA